jgi:hypothetical protein
MKPLYLFLTLMLSACTQSARITLRNESGGPLAYATSKGARPAAGKDGLPVRKLSAGQSVEVPLATVVSRGLDLPFVLLGTNVATSESLFVQQDQAKRSQQFDFPFPQQKLTDRWSQQDYLGRFLTRKLGSMVIVDPADESYWKPLGRTPVKLKVTNR